VINQNLFAALADLGAILLEARQHGLVAIIHHRAAMPGDIAGASVIPGLLLLRRGRRGQKDQWKDRNDQKKFAHLLNPLRRRSAESIRHTCDVNMFAAILSQPRGRKWLAEPDAVGRTLTSISH
jgi:hypothetical protein